ncbi:type 4a pilus biogenesis protein PilO [Candidatus Daviesbacteria bacterium]|nr:type 4a pilus biogenesis protein PilO [Candidatus Daviesbacteria bacterium]
MNPQRFRYFVYIKPVLKNPYIKTYSSVVFSLIAITFFSLFAIRPTFKTIIALQKDIKAQKLVLNQLLDKSHNLETAKKNYDQIDPSVKNEIDNLLPDKLSLGTLINDLNALSLKYNASVSGLQFQPISIDPNRQPATKDSDLKEIVFNLNLKGNYSDLVNVLEQIRSLPHLITIDIINITKLDAGLTVSITAKSYY